MERRFGAFNSLAATILTVAELSNQSLPFVRIPHFAAHAAKVLQLTNAVVSYLTPVIPNHLRSKWEHFASGSQDNLWLYINDTINYQRTFRHFYGPMPEEYNWTIKESIYDDFTDVPENSTHPYFLPEWHIFPLVMRSYGPANYGALI